MKEILFTKIIIAEVFLLMMHKIKAITSYLRIKTKQIIIR
jgi:hypothetical protein